MSKLNKIGYSLQDVAIVQSSISNQTHRGDVDPFVDICGRKSFPIFVAPMASVTDEKNYKVWIENNVTPVIPRSIQMRLSIKERLNLARTTFVSFSLREAERIFAFVDKAKAKKDFFNNGNIYICIDIAHGTLSNLFDICRNIKIEYKSDVVIMTGNVANPDAYENYCKSGIDFMRACIGTGSRCTTSCAVGIHYPTASLIDELVSKRNEIKQKVNYVHGIKSYYNKEKKEAIDEPFTITKIIVDGGISWYDDINKSLALGADAVMIGRLFAECEESCGKIEIDENTHVKKRLYSGMSHRSMQKITGGDGSKVSEGICQYVEVKYPVKHFLSNMESYLRSCMTYTNSSTIEDLKKSEMIILGSGQTYKK